MRHPRPAPALLLALTLAAAPAAEAPQPLTAQADKLLAAVQPELIEWRRHLHQHPELSREERATADRLAEEFAALGIDEVDRVAQTGLVARIHGRDRSAPVVAVRGDIDALPITEQTGLEYSSRTPGVMHACGHDVHATWAVGAAALLASGWSDGKPPAGDVLILLQPAEEVAWGALAMLESGALDGVAAIFGGHVDRRFAVGEVVAQPGPVAAATDSFEIVLRGRGAHGARPHEGVDPVVGAAALVCQLQTLVSRRLAPGEPGVVTIGQLAAGSAPNVIPETARLAGTLRAQTPAVRELLRGGVREMAQAVATAHHLELSLEFLDATPPLINGERETAWAATAAAELLGDDALRRLPEPNMGGEDFAYFLESIPGSFVRVGAREPGGEVIAAHSPRFYAADGAIFVGAALLAATARRASGELAAARP
jgi:hippurate hydrolase